jgi:hypothetical protein
MKGTIKKAMGLMILLFVGCSSLVWASEQRGFRLEILIDGQVIPEYWLSGTTYVEALKGKEYAIRITNPLPVRAAIALSVDGLNTIDARHTDARSAHKWVLGPYESITIQGWQTNSQQARKFFFTSEEKSYGAWLGKTQNLGVISAVFFKEKELWKDARAASQVPMEAMNQPACPAAAKSAKEAASLGAAVNGRSEAEDYAATGIGDKIRHDVYQIHLDLESDPCTTLSLRYEYRPVLARLGILPPRRFVDPLERRQHSHGFDGMAYCPDPR